MIEPRLQQQLAFLAEVDKMKSIFRQTLLIDRSRRENDAEHSWHFALAAMVLQEHGAPGLDMLRILKMALTHDLVEVYAGDTFAYDEAGYLDKAAREAAAAKKLFALLPKEQSAEFSRLWKEFEAGATREAAYANAIDRIQPFLNNALTGGYTWKKGHVRKEQVYARMAPVKDFLPALWDFVRETIEKYAQEGAFSE